LAGLAFGVIGCSQPGDNTAVKAGKDAQGNPYVHVDGQQVDRNLQKAGRDLKAEAGNLGRAVQRGADEMDAKVGPVARQMLDDASISAKIKAKLLADPEVKSLRIDVDTAEGRVALNGTVSSADQKAVAERLARQTEGVKSVTNLLQVNPSAEPPPSR
jgi:hyperosmotically inducible protein